MAMECPSCSVTSFADLPAACIKLAQVVSQIIDSDDSAYPRSIERGPPNCFAEVRDQNVCAIFGGENMSV